MKVYYYYFLYVPMSYSDIIYNYDINFYFNIIIVKKYFLIIHENRIPIIRPIFY